MDHDAILAVVDEMFVALKNRDAETWERLMHPDGKWFIQQIGEGGSTQLHIDSTSDRIAALPTIDSGIEETYESPTITIDESIATFWAPFEVAMDGQRVACGTNSFQLIKVDGQWLVANIMFTQRTADCTAPP